MLHIAICDDEQIIMEQLKKAFRSAQTGLYCDNVSQRRGTVRYI